MLTYIQKSDLYDRIQEKVKNHENQIKKIDKKTVSRKRKRYGDNYRENLKK